MSLSDRDLLEVNSLCQALADGAATEAERSKLNRWLSESEDARGFYVRMMALSAALYDCAGEMQAEAPDIRALPAARPKISAWVWALSGLAAAAVVLLAFHFGMENGGANSGGEAGFIAEQEPDEPVGRLSASKDCLWQGAASQIGDELRRGQRIELRSGFAEITFDCGAQITLEGPATLELRSAWVAALQQGSLKANVPSEAIGFRVSNSSVDVVDLGTEFSMLAEADGATEVFVLKGSVEASGRNGLGQPAPPMILKTRQARRFAKGIAAEVRDRDRKLEKFLRKIVLNRLAPPAGYVHWSFDEANGDHASAQTLGLAAGGFEAHLFGPRNAAPSVGKWGGALALDGKQFARAPFPGISQRVARTVAFWVDIPADASPSEADAMVAWPLDSGGIVYPVEIGWNRNPNDGAFGALRTGIGGGSIVGVTPLRDGRWHHLAVVFTPKRKSDSAMQIRQYVDGRLESPSARHLGKRIRRGPIVAQAVAGAVEEALWMGCALDANQTDQPHFRGSLDELFVADRALAPQEIRRLMEKNAPAPPETVAAD
jgi:Concanavalin A-like lectin/glucanases superfamily/FecR protein